MFKPSKGGKTSNKLKMGEKPLRKLEVEKGDLKVKVEGHSPIETVTILSLTSGIIKFLIALAFVAFLLWKFLG